MDLQEHFDALNFWSGVNIDGYCPKKKGRVFVEGEVALKQEL